MNKLDLKRFSFTVILFLLSLGSWAQTVADSTTPSIENTMRSHDKIYVVMAVCIVILVVFFLYLVRIDLKVSKKEKML